MPRPWYRAGKREWYTTMNGKQVGLGVTDPADEGAAWAALRQLVRESVREVVNPTPAVRPGKVPELVGQFLAERAATVEPVTLKGYANHLKWLATTFPADTARSLQVARLLTLAAGVTTWGETHRANVLATCGAFLRWAGRSEAIPLPPKASRGADSVVPEAVFRRCLVESTGDFHQLLRFLWHTGCRPGEATGLTAEAVAWEAGTVRIKQHKTRRKGKVRTVYLCPEAVAVLTEQRDRHGSGLLFRGLRGRRLSLQSMTMRFQRLSAKVGHPVTSYQFRHTWATRALAAGVPAAQVAEMLGTSVRMVELHYGHLTAEADLLRQQAERVSRGKAAG